VPFLDHRLDAGIALSSAGISALSCLLAGLAPAWRSARLAPAVAMHSDPNLAMAGGRVPLVERLLGPLLPRAFVFRIPLRNVFRARRRSFYTVVGIAFALVLTVATQSMFDAIDALMSRMSDFSERWDVSAVYDEPFGADRLAEVRRWRGVESVQGAQLVPAEMAGPSRTNEGAITALDPRATFHGFEVLSGEPVETALAGGRLVVSQALADKIGAKAGDTVSVKTPYRDERTTLTVGSVVKETLGAPAFVSLEEARENVGSSATEYNAMYLNVDPRRADAIKAELTDLRGSISVVVKAEMVARFEEMLAFTNFYQGLLFMFGFAMGFVVIYNTFTANVLERTREIATMRTIGESNARLAVMVTIENVLLALAGVPLGIWAGMRTAEALYAQLSSEAFTLDAYIQPSSIAWIVGAVLLVLLVSEVPPVRRIFRLDLAEATKVME
jgi:putative ABC transport system permease protein